MPQSATYVLSIRATRAVAGNDLDEVRASCPLSERVVGHTLQYVLSLLVVFTLFIPSLPKGACRRVEGLVLSLLAVSLSNGRRAPTPVNCGTRGRFVGAFRRGPVVRIICGSRLEKCLPVRRPEL